MAVSLRLEENLPPHEKPPAHGRNDQTRNDLWAIPGKCLRPSLLDRKDEQSRAEKESCASKEIDAGKCTPREDGGDVFVWPQVRDGENRD